MHWRRAHLLGSCAAAYSSGRLLPWRPIAWGASSRWALSFLVTSANRRAVVVIGPGCIERALLQLWCPDVWGRVRATAGPFAGWAIYFMGGFLLWLSVAGATTGGRQPSHLHIRVIHTVWRFAALHPSAPQLAWMVAPVAGSGRCCIRHWVRC